MGSLYEFSFSFFKFLLISFDRLFSLTQPILPPTFELSEILNKFAVFSKPTLSILSLISSI